MIKHKLNRCFFLIAKYQTIKLETLASNLQNSRPSLIKTKSINNSDIKSHKKETSNNQKSVKYNSSSLSRLSNESSSFSTTSSSSSASSTTSNNRANSFEYDFDSDFANIDFVLNNDIAFNNLNSQNHTDNNNNNQINNNNNTNNKKIVNVHHHNLLLNYNDENLAQIKQMRRVFDFFYSVISIKIKLI